ncbi:MAG: hypothetical protein NZL88_11505, partial [Gaiellaceae bacterium]|nr:hypothetical protein [Gaiellaceae bacterium]
FAVRIALLLDRDERLAVLPLRDPAAEGLLASLAPEERYASWRLARPDGSLVGYGAGVPELLRATRLGRPLGCVLGLVPAPALDRSYRLVARHRGRLGRLVPDCPVRRLHP